MKFRNLQKDQQDELIDNFYPIIEAEGKENDVDYIEPTFDEYADFFDELYGEFEIIDGMAESAMPTDMQKTYRVEFDGKKVVLLTFDRDDDYSDEDE